MRSLANVAVVGEMPVNAVQLDEVIGQSLGNYRIVKQLGQGGFGVVYLAEHPLIGKKVAIKLLLPEISANKEMVDRFFNEARAATLIKDSGIVDVFDFGHHANGSAYFVMEFLEGESLATVLQRGKIHPDLIRAMVLQLTDSLAKAHDRQIIHRDLKPDNIFLVPNGKIECGYLTKILDYGIAKLGVPGDSGVVKTQSGAMMGTPAYMSPEQCRGAKHVDARSDIYSLGIIIYEMAVGRRPFLAEQTFDMLTAQVMTPPPAPRLMDAAVPADLEEIILRCLAKNPDHRFQSMRELQSRMRQLPRMASTEMTAMQPPAGALVQPSPWADLGITGAPAPTRPGVPHALAAGAVVQRSAQPVPTTMGGAVGQSVVRRVTTSRRKVILSVLGAAAVIGVVVGILAAQGRGSQQKLTPTGTSSPEAPVGPLTLRPDEAAAQVPIDAGTPVAVQIADAAVPVKAAQAEAPPSAGSGSRVTGSTRKRRPEAGRADARVRTETATKPDAGTAGATDRSGTRDGNIIVPEGMK